MRQGRRKCRYRAMRVFSSACGLSLFGPGVEVLPCATFGDVVRSVETGEADAGVMAIENSIAGSIMPNYRLLQKGSLTIVGGCCCIYASILWPLPGVGMESVEEVRSHPMALLQCMDFWSVRIIAVSDSWRRKIPL